MYLPVQRYEQIKHEVVDMYEECEISTFPIDCFDIASKLYYILVPYSKLNDHQLRLAMEYSSEGLCYGKYLKQECTATTSSTTITTAMNVRDGPSFMRLVTFISDTISQIVLLREMNRNRRLTSLPNTVLPHLRLSTLRSVVHRGKLQQRFLFPNRLRFTSSYTFRNG